MSDLGTIVEKCRIRLNEITERYFKDTELKLAIGSSYSKYTLDLIEHDCGFFKTTVYIGFEQYNEFLDFSEFELPYYKTEILARIFPTGEQQPIVKQMKRFASNWTSYVAGGFFMFDGYFEKGNGCQLLPVPNFTETPWDEAAGTYATSGLRLDYYYMPEFPTFDSEDDFEFDVEFPTILENLIIIDTCINVALLNKSLKGGEMGMDAWYKELGAWEDRLQTYFKKNPGPSVIQPYGTNYNTPY